MGAAPLNLSAGMVPKTDISAGLVPQQQPQSKGFWSTALDSTGLPALAQAVAHPIDTAMGIPAQVKAAYQDSKQHLQQAAEFAKQGSIGGAGVEALQALPVLGSFTSGQLDDYAKGNTAGMAGRLAGTLAGNWTTAAPELVAGKAAVVVPKVAEGLQAAGDFAQDQGGKIINRATGTLKADFKRGANPGRGYLAQGGGMATSMSDLAEKSAAIKDATGKAVRDAYSSADQSGVKIPVQDVVDSLQGPMKNVFDALDKGGAPASLRNSIVEHAQSFEKPLNAGFQQGYMTPSQVWDLKKNIADFTNWGDQAQQNLNKIKQQQNGALGGLLEKYVPDVAPLNESYQDLTKMANRAQERANTGSLPLTSHAYNLGSMAVGAAIGGGEKGGLGALAGTMAAKALRSVPVRTAIAKGLYDAGGKLGDLGSTLQESLGNVAKQADGEVIKPPVTQQGLPSGWAQLGTAKLKQHILALPSDTLKAADIDALKSTPLGQRILAFASGLTPNSKAMAALAAQAALASQSQQQKK